MHPKIFVLTLQILILQTLSVQKNIGLQIYRGGARGAYLAHGLSDYASRNPVACQDSNCQVCTFVSDLETSVVLTLSATDVKYGAVSMPFPNHPAWTDLLRDCLVLQRVDAHLKEGTHCT